MEQFNLDTWLKDKNRKVTTRLGNREVRIICWDRKNNNNKPIITLMIDPEGNEYITSHSINGWVDDKERYPDKRDLFFADEEEILSEDERIRKGLIKGLSTMRDIHNQQTFSDDAINIDYAIAWLEKQGEQKSTCLLDNSKPNVNFPFEAKVKSTGKIVTIHDGQLCPGGKEWIKYQSNFEDGYKIYEPNDLELVCGIGQHPSWNEDDEKMLNQIQEDLREYYVSKKGYPYVAEPDSVEVMEYNWLKSIEERMKGE